MSDPGYWQSQLVEMAKRDGKSQEMIDGIDTSLESVLALGLGYSKEHIAYAFIQAFGAYGASLDFKESMMKIQNMAGTSIENIQAIGDDILKLAEPTKPTSKAPYYHKDKQKWWK